MMNRKHLTVLWLITMLLLGCASKPATPRDPLNLAEQALDRGDYLGALDLLQPYTNETNPRSRYLLGMASMGSGRFKDAIRYLEPLAVAGDQRAYFPLGAAFRHRKQPEKGHPWLYQAAELGDEKAKIFLAISYAEGLGTDNERRDPFRLLDEVGENTALAAMVEEARTYVTFLLDMRHGPDEAAIPDKGCVFFAVNTYMSEHRYRAWCDVRADENIQAEGKQLVDDYIAQHLRWKVAYWMKAYSFRDQGGAVINGIVYRGGDYKMRVTFRPYSEFHYGIRKN
jgi:tetratricopeptide (TPR) repeat protein